MKEYMPKGELNVQSLELCLSSFIDQYPDVASSLLNSFAF